MKGRRVIAVLAASVVAAVVVSLIVTRSRSTSPSAINPTPTPRPTPTRLVRHCSASGCAVVNLSRSLPPITIFYGASCEGIEGSWFFNVTEQGGNDQLRPSYALQWSFMPGATEAMPNGRTLIQPTNGSQITMTLSNGALHLTGTQRPKPQQVDATGTLVVRLSGSTSAPTLTFTETGLADAEKALGLVSPFDLGGNPLTVPVDMVKTMDGC